ncbi:MAG: nitroreductase family protein [Mycobacterium sp.]
MTRTAAAQGPNKHTGHRKLGSLAAGVLRLKVRLQFTGWLQYAPNAAAAVAFLGLAVLGWVIGLWPIALFWVPAGIGCALLAVLAFDLTTVKLGLRPTEALPRPRDDLDAFDLMRMRRSCRSFQARNLIDEHRADLMQSVRRNSHAEALLGNRAIRLEYVAAPLTVWPVVGAHEFLVAIAPREYNRMAIIDVGRSLQRVVLDATRQGLATCWIGPGADHASIVGHLGDRFDPEEDHIVCVCAVGYRSRFTPTFIRLIQKIQHRRLPLRALFFADAEFRESLSVDTSPFDEFGRCYEACQWSPSSFNAQTTRCVGVVERVGGQDVAARFDFYAATASRFYAPVALGIWCANWETGCRALGIPGHFAALGSTQAGIRRSPEPPRYDVSWVIDPAAHVAHLGTTNAKGRG